MTTRPSQSDSLTLTGLLGDLRLLLIVFVCFRLILLMVYQPLFTQGMERGVTAGGDFFYYYQLGALSGDGLLPFRDWWSEFPPIPSFLDTLLYIGFGRSYSSFAMVFSALMLAFDVGNLLLVRRIGSRLHGANTGMALAWVYALMPVPAVFIFWNFEPMVAFFLLWALAALIDARDTRSAIAAWLGALVKFTPALILGAVWRYRSTGAALRYTLIAVGGFVLVYLPLLLGNADMTLPSLLAQFNKASYQSVWALIDGNYTTGNFGPSLERLDPAAAYQLEGNPPVIPGFIRLGTAALIGLAVFVTARRRDARGVAAFVAITLLIFFLQAQGWSPQWLAQIVPLILICFPTRNGVIAVILLSLVSFAEYPFLFIRTGDTGGVITGDLVAPFVALVLARTTILMGMCIALYQVLRRDVPA